MTTRPFPKYKIYILQATILDYKCFNEASPVNKPVRLNAIRLLLSNLVYIVPHKVGSAVYLVLSIFNFQF